MQNNIQNINFGARLVFKQPKSKLKDFIIIENTISLPAVFTQRKTEPNQLQKLLFGIRKKIKLPTFEGQNANKNITL